MNIIENYPQAPVQDQTEKQAGFYARNRLRLAASVTALAVAIVGCTNRENTEPSTTNETTPTEAVTYPDGTETTITVPTPEADESLIDPEFRNSFFANMRDHDTRVTCVVELNSEEAKLFHDDLYGSENRMQEIITESPFSHWWSLATSDGAGNFQDYTTNQARLDVTIDQDWSANPRGGNLVCDISKDGKISYVPSEQPIYPKGIPSPQVVANIIDNTFSVVSSGFANGRDMYTRTSGVHTGNGEVIAPSWSNMISFPTREEYEQAPAKNILLKGFDRPDLQLIDKAITENDKEDTYHTELLDMPEVSIGDIDAIEAGDSLIISGFDRQTASDRSDRFFYRVVVVGKSAEGGLVVATGIEDSGSFDPEEYSPAGYDGYGSAGAGIYTVEGQLVGTAGQAYIYETGWDIKVGDKEVGEEPELNKFIDSVHARLGLPTPRSAELARREAIEREKAKDPNGYVYLDLPPVAFTEIMFINRLPSDPNTEPED